MLLIALLSFGRRVRCSSSRDVVWMPLVLGHLVRFRPNHVIVSLLVFLASLDDGNEFQVVHLTSLDGGLLPHLLDLVLAEGVTDVH